MVDRYMHNNKMVAIMEVGASMLKGELAFREGDDETAWCDSHP